MAKLRTGRTRVKKRNNGLYKTVMVVGEDPEGTVETIDVIMLPQYGVTPSPSAYSLTKGETTSGDTKYINQTLTMSGANPIGQPFLITATMKDSAGLTVGTTQNFYVTVQDDGGIIVSGVTLTQNSGAEDFTFRAVIKGTNFTDVKNIDVYLTPDTTGSAANPDKFSLVLASQTSAKKIFKNQNVAFLNAENVIDLEYLAAVTLLDTNGDELDYDHYLILAQE